MCGTYYYVFAITLKIAAFGEEVLGGNLNTTGGIFGRRYSKEGLVRFLVL